MSDVVLRATADVSGAVAGLDRVREKIRETKRESAGGPGGGGLFGSMAGSIGAAVSIGAVANLVKQSVAEANQFDVSMARVSMSLERVGRGGEAGRVRSFAGMIEEKTGIDDAEVAAHMARVIVAGETNIANAAAKVKLALDVQSAGFGDASSTLDAFTKAGADQEMMLKRLAAKLGVATTDGMTLNQVMAAMQDRVRGASERMHEATKGTEAMRVAWDNLKQAMGENFLAMYGKGGVVRTALGLDRPGESERVAFRRRMSQGDTGSGYTDDGVTGYSPLAQYASGAISRREYMARIRGEYASFERTSADGALGTGTPTQAGSIGKEGSGLAVGGGVRRIEVSVRADNRAPTQASARAF